MDEKDGRLKKIETHGSDLGEAVQSKKKRRDGRGRRKAMDWRKGDGSRRGEGTSKVEVIEEGERCILVRDKEGEMGLAERDPQHVDGKSEQENNEESAPTQ
jgi:hypothetical protein